MTRPLIITGAPGSPYTRKVIAAARYLRIAYRFISDLAVSGAMPQPRIKLWPVCYFPDGEDLIPETDSTPILRKLETGAPNRSLTPADPRLALIDALIEDYADEWLTKAMFHYRWTYDADVRKSRRVLPNWFENPLTDQALEAAGETFAERQIGRLGVVGSSPATAALIEESFTRLLACLERRLAQSPFILGERPGTADFGLYGQLTQLALFDPTPSRLVEDLAPRVLAWTIAMEDLSGLEGGDWTPFESLPETVYALLAEIGATHARLLLANDAAIRGGEVVVRTTITGRPWEQSVFPYQVKCLTALRQRHARLSPAERAAVDIALRAGSCFEIFAPV